MERDYRFDIVRVLCMTFIVAVVHLYGYIYNVVSANIIPCIYVLCNSCLGLFTFTSGYLLGKKYDFSVGKYNIKDFYINRVIRIIPLFLIASFSLCIIGFNGIRATLNGVLCLSPFVKPRPMTLWYIPVIIICYLLTPIVCRKSVKWRILSSLIISVLVMIGTRLFQFDWRLFFNLMFYMLGLVTAPYFTWQFSSKTG